MFSRMRLSPVGLMRCAIAEFMFSVLHKLGRTTAMKVTCFRNTARAHSSKALPGDVDTVASFKMNPEPADMSQYYWHQTYGTRY